MIMAETHVISALVTKRGELAGQLENHKKEIARVAEELRHIDRTIKIFNPDYDLRSIKAKKVYTKSRYFKHGEANKMLLDILRLQNAPMSTHDITSEVITRKAIIELDEAEEKALQASVYSILDRLEKNETVRKAGKDGLNTLWELVQVEL
jgi:ribosomal protein S8E